MKRSRSAVALATTALAMLCLVRPSGASPLANPGFESGTLSPWFQGIGTLDFPHDEFWTITSDRAASGTWSAQNVGNNELRQNFDAVATSSITEISFSLRQEGSFALLAAVQLHYSDGSFSQRQVSPAVFGVWEGFDVTDLLEIGKELSGISFFGVRADQATRTYLDDVLIAVPEPGTLLLTLTGLTALAGRRARGHTD